MTIWQIIRYTFAIIAQAVATLYLSLSVYFLAGYYIDTDNHLRHEYLIGVWVGLLQATGFSLGSALLASSVKTAISRRTFRILTVPALIIGIVFLTLYFGSLVYDLSTRT
jgi:hypothetical protein